FFFSSRRRHTRFSRDWSSDVCSSDLELDPVRTASTPPQPKTTPTETLASYTPPKKAEKIIKQASEDEVEAPDSTGIGKMRWPVQIGRASCREREQRLISRRERKIGTA